jgi:amino acid adenylation domain-containing protein
LLALPTDRPRPVVQSYRGDTHAFTVSDTITTSLTAIGRQAQGTLFMVLAAAFDLLLARYSGQKDVCVGTVVANRSRAELEKLIGFFANTLVLRTQVDERTSFMVLLEQVRQVTLDAYANQDVPFEQLVEAIRPERHTSHAPLFQVMLVLQNAPVGQMVLPGLTLEPLPLAGTTAKFDLLLAIEEVDGGLQCSLEYNTDLFDRATAVRLSDHYTRLLGAIAVAPQEHLSTLSMLGNEELTQLRQWNQTAVQYPEVKSLHQMVEIQAQQNPERVAVVFEGCSLSYAALNTQANQLAHYLRQCGVGTGSLVAICAERALEMVVGLLGILKAGGAYMPLDPAYPAERLQYMLKDAQPVLVLVQSHLLGVLPAGCARFELDTQRELLSGYSGANPQAGVGPGDLAYVIYTSGSTGRPKGVAVEHGGIVNRLQWMQAEYRLSAADRVLQKTPYSFDVSVWEFFWPLAYGATLVVARPEGHKDVDYLSRLIVAERITTLHFVPPMLEVFLGAGNITPCADTLRQVMCSGQVLPWELQQRFFTLMPGVELHNLYGPTEASVDVTSWACRLDSGLSCVPIGRPIANIRIYLLDPYLNPVPVGVAGELYIAGVGLARGYLGRADLTGQTFIPDPFGESGGRMYKSGDLARYLPGGEIEYLGRVDHQVKIRGLRIELGEIEFRLSQHPGVREAVVLAQDERLVAYVTREDGEGETLETGDLRAYLGRVLPEYMVPQSVMILDSMPLSANGKLDRRSLPSAEQLLVAVPYAAPEGEIECEVATIWQTLLQVPKVGRHDNFFELGGHSLLAVQVVSQIRQRLQVEISITKLFGSTTLAVLAEEILSIYINRFDAEDIERFTAEVDNLSDEELHAMLAEDEQLFLQEHQNCAGGNHE